MSGSKKHDYFGGGPFSGDYSDLAQSVMRIAEKAAKEETKEEVKNYQTLTYGTLEEECDYFYSVTRRLIKDSSIFLW